MLKNYFKMAWRNLQKHRSSSIINIGGLAIGMSVAMLIGFWVVDEWSFDKQSAHYASIAQVMENQALNKVYGTQKEIPIPVATQLRTKFGSDFKEVILSSLTQDHVLAINEKKLATQGNFMEPRSPELFNLTMLAGDRSGLKDPHSIFLSSSLAKAFFGGADPLGKTIRMDDSLAVKVTGVYRDFPYNSSFRDISFLSPWDLYVSADEETRRCVRTQEWEDNGWQVFVQVADHADMATVSEKIKNIKADNDKYVKPTDLLKPTMFLFPMGHWHLYSDFKNGVSVGGRIQYVRLFGLIGVFVLLLACINFMNLSTARSEKRAKEVGIRKAIGSLRSQLIAQFFGESLLVAVLAFALALVLVQLSLPFFNALADKKISLPWLNPLFWLAGITFSLVTGLIAGSYPALYLSSFQPVKVLKGAMMAGRLASLPRKILVVTQFTVSIALIIGTTIVFRQIQYARNRPVGYDQNGLLTIQMHTKDIHAHLASFRTDLLKTVAVTEVAEATSSTTETGDSNGGLNWTGKSSDATADNFAMKGVTQEYAKTVGLQFLLGRDFRTGHSGFDASTMILSESSAKGMALKQPLGKTVEWSGGTFTVIGVVKDMVMESPYEAPIPTIYYLASFPIYTLSIRISPKVSAATALASISPIFSKYSPAEPFDYKFVDQEYAHKFDAEQRVGKLASFFTILAVFISCLGLFGLASFVAEQRAKEIGVRKVLGATVFNLWRMLSRDFVALVLLSGIIAIPVSWWLLHRWLQQYEYRTGIPWWILAGAGLGAIIITLATVSYQSVKASLANPVKNLRSE